MTSALNERQFVAVERPERTGRYLPVHDIKHARYDAARDEVR
ncbi:hypothetical protein AB5I41_10640 [Sphingomonas sp. MMS24-JH45]